MIIMMRIFILSALLLLRAIIAPNNSNPTTSPAYTESAIAALMCGLSAPSRLLTRTQC